MRLRSLLSIIVLVTVIEVPCAAVGAQVLIFANGFETGSTCSAWSETVTPEICDGKDNNCDGYTDEGVLLVLYRDADADDFGDPDSTIETCEPLSGYVIDGTDCNDMDATVNPGFAEICDAKDNDCNSVVDDKDVDADTHIDSFCTAYSGPNPVDDCNDDVATVNPDQPELCGDGLDNDCDGVAENKDFDGDLRIDSACGGTDCDDSDAEVYPGALESCDGKDNDCNSETDDKDRDRDDHVDEVCVAYTGPLPIDDCDDAHFGVNPERSEVCGNLVDEDCSGAWDDKDGDGDGWVSADPLCGGDDCDDNHPLVYPSAPEFRDGKDNDCDADGRADETLVGVGELIITEILYDSSEAPDERYEWFEVFNPTDRPLALRAWLLRDQSGAFQEVSEIDGDVVVQPREFAVLCATGSSAYNGGVSCDYEYGHLTFANTADELILDYGGTIVDEVWYDEASAWPPATNGSLNLDPDAFALDNNVPVNWCSHPVGREIPNGDKATPGVSNISCTASPEDPAIVAVHPSNGVDAGGTAVRIVGAGFTDTTDVLVGGFSCIDWSVLSDSEIICTTPWVAAGTADVTVVGGGASDTLAGCFEFTTEATAPSSLVDAAQLEGPSVLTITRGLWSRAIHGSVTKSGVTGVPCPQGGEFAEGDLSAEIGVGPAGSDPLSNGSWVWFPAFCVEQVGSANHFVGTVSVENPGAYSYCYRFSVDGGQSFNYADLDGGFFSPLETGTLTVQ